MYRIKRVPQCSSAWLIATGCLLFLLPLVSIGGEQTASTNVLADLLETQPLRLSTEDEKGADQFVFTIGFSLPQDETRIQPFKILALRDRDQAGLIVVTSTGLPFCYLSDHFGFSFDSNRPGQINLQQGLGGKLLFGGVKGESSAHMNLVMNDSEKTIVTLDLGGILRPILEKAHKAEFDKEKATIGVQTDKTFVSIHLVPVHELTNRFPVESVSITSLSGGATTFSDFRMAIGKDRQMLAVKIGDIESLGLPIQRAVYPSQRLDLSYLPPKDFPRNEQEKAAAQKLATLLGLATTRSNVAGSDQLVRLLVSLREKSAGESQETEFARLIGIRGFLDMPALRRSEETRDHYSHLRWDYDRSVAVESMVNKFDRRAVENLLSTLTLLATDHKRSWKTRFLALDLIGDIGVPQDLKLLPEIEETLAKETDPVLRVALASVRVRLQKTQPGDIDFLTDAALDKKTPLAVRLRCLEALSFKDAVPVDFSAVSGLLKEAFQSTDYLVPDSNRYFYDVASSVRGRQLLMESFKLPSTDIPMKVVIDAIRNSFNSVEDKDFASFAEACEKLALDPKTGYPEVEVATRIVYQHEMGVDFITKLLRQGAERKDSSIERLALRFAGLKSVVLECLPEFETCMSSEDPQVRGSAVVVLDRIAGPKGFERVVPLLQKGLGDPDLSVRTKALYTIARSQARKFEVPRSLIPNLLKIIENESDPEALKWALYNLELLSKGDFKITGDPRKDGLPKRDEEARKWWQDNVAREKAAALLWARNSNTVHQ